MKYLKIIIGIAIALSFFSFIYFESKTAGLISAGMAVVLTLLYMYLEKKDSNQKK